MALCRKRIVFLGEILAALATDLTLDWTYQGVIMMLEVSNVEAVTLIVQSLIPVP